MLVDTGILVAAADAGDPNFKEALHILEQRGPKVVTDAIVAEAYHLIAARVGRSIAAAFLASLDEDLFIECSTRADRDRARALCDRYLDAGLDYTDGLTVAIAERLGETTLATLDRRHFGIVRPAHTNAFDLVPARAG